jgi:hypothetical protein
VAAPAAITITRGTLGVVGSVTAINSPTSYQCVSLLCEVCVGALPLIVMLVLVVCRGCVMWACRWKQGTSLTAITTVVSGTAFTGPTTATLSWTPPSTQTATTYYFTATATNTAGTSAPSVVFTVVVA